MEAILYTLSVSSSMGPRYSGTFSGIAGPLPLPLQHDTHVVTTAVESGSKAYRGLTWHLNREQMSGTGGGKSTTGRPWQLLATGEAEICTKTTQLGVYTGRGCDWRGLAGAWTTSYREPRWAHVRAAEASSLHEVSIPVHSRVNRTSHARFYTSYGADESMFHLCLLCQ